MIDNETFPADFNTRQIFALIKDEAKSSSNLNNIRPISVSDCFTNIFEKLFLIEIDKRLIDSPKQFGFK